MPGRPHFFLSFLSLLLLGAAAIFAAASYGVYLYLSPGPLTQPQLVLIERGSGVSKIARTLEDEEVIAHGLLFKVAARLTGQHASLKAGEYQFPPKISIAESLWMLHEGEVFGRKFTIPEGFTSYQIVQILEKVEELEGSIKDVPPEGSLLPNTYDYQSSEDRTEIIARLQDAMISTALSACHLSVDQAVDFSFSDLLKMACGQPPIKTVADFLTLASIVEKETAVPEERRRVAGVFINRLKRGIPLQTDPTVIYAITKGKVKNEGKGPLGRRLLSKDLKFKSPYNTYLNAGLPPGPIANPGPASIEATLNPETHDYIYFVADGTGGHVFAKSLAEHNRNVAKWRKIRRQKK